MAIFSLSSTAGYGINMSSLLEAAFGFANDRIGLSFQFNPSMPSGAPEETATWNVHGGAADTMSANYHIDGAGLYHVQSVTFGGLPLTVSGLSLSASQVEFEAGSWVQHLNDGADSFYGTNHVDVIHAGRGDDIVRGYDGNDVISGDDGDDILDGGAGDDSLFGGTGRDVLSGGIGHNHLDGGSGYDVAVLEGSSDDYAIERQPDGSVLVRNGSGTIIDALVDIEALWFSDGSIAEIAPPPPVPPSPPTETQSPSTGGGVSPLPSEPADTQPPSTGGSDAAPAPAAAGSEAPSPAGNAPVPAPSATVGGDTSHAQSEATETWIYGLWWPEKLKGTDLNDHIFGHWGNDWLYGGAGNDWLHGGAGRDHLYGGSGQDAFVFDRKARPGNVDKIADFSTRDDTIWIENAVFGKIGSAGALKKGAFHTGETAHDAGDRVIYDKKSGALSYDRDGTGAAEQVQFAQLSKNLKLTYADFLII